VSRFLTVHQHN